jgi:hypothetical protein
MKEQLHPLLDPLFMPITVAVFDRIITPQMIALNLLSADEDPIPPFGEEANDILMKSFVRGVWLALLKAEVSIPAGYPIEELELTDNLVKGFGDLRMTVSGNRLLLSFSGDGALIKEIDTPLNVKLAVDQRKNPQEPLVKLEMGKKPRFVPGQFHTLPASTPIQ